MKNQRGPTRGEEQRKDRERDGTTPECKWMGERFAFGCPSILLLTEEESKHNRAETAFAPICSHIRYATDTFKGGSKNKEKPLDCCPVLPNAASMTPQKVSHKTETSADVYLSRQLCLDLDLKLAEVICRPLGEIQPFCLRCSDRENHPELPI